VADPKSGVRSAVRLYVALFLAASALFVGITYTGFRQAADHRMRRRRRLVAQRAVAAARPEVRKGTRSNGDAPLSKSCIQNVPSDLSNPYSISHGHHDLES
jgi:hypothetical protein